MILCVKLKTLLKLANLAPDIVKLIWENRQPETLTLDNLRKGIPESWDEQRDFLYFSFFFTMQYCIIAGAMLHQKKYFESKAEK